jgi:hypothetical protein
MEHLKDCASTTELALELLQIPDLKNNTIRVHKILKPILGASSLQTIDIINEDHQAQVNMDKYNHRLDDYISFIVTVIESVTIDKLLSETL